MLLIVHESRSWYEKVNSLLASRLLGAVVLAMRQHITTTAISIVCFLCPRDVLCVLLELSTNKRSSLFLVFVKGLLHLAALELASRLPQARVNGTHLCHERLQQRATLCTRTALTMAASCPLFCQ